MDKADLSALLKAPDNITFIKNAYQKFLGRSIDFQDLTDHLRSLKRGMSREAMLYCIACSDEFNSRFPVPELSVLRLSYFAYLAKKPLLAFRNSRKATGSSPYRSCPMPNGSPNPLCEYETLSRCQIRTLSSLLTSYADSQAFSYSGVIAKGVLEERGAAIAQELPSHQSWEQPSVKIESCFSTDPAFIHSLLVGQSLFAFAEKIKGTFLFTMPSVPLPPDSISIVWGSEWAVLDGDASSRWLFSERNHISLVLYNNSNRIRKITLRFSLTALGDHSEIIASFNGADKKCYVFSSDLSMDVEETFYLHPFYNRISFSYVGSGVSFEEGSPLSAKFAVRPQADYTECTGSSLLHPLYQMTSSLPEAEDYKYILPDFITRYLLHKNGFFEVAAWQIFDDYQYHALPVTRYDDSSNQQKKKGYYTFAEEDPLLIRSSIILYAAKRKAMPGIKPTKEAL